jgi:uncharacterized protein
VTVLEKLMPRQVEFFDFFDRQAEKIIEGCKGLTDLLENFVEVVDKAKRLKAIEHEGDLITHQCIEMLHKTFITPLDREDIHRLISKMDDILDLTEAVSQRLSIYEITSIPAEAKQLGNVLIASAERVSKAVHGLRDMKNAPQILVECIEINRLENEADTLLRTAVGNLFKREKDPLTVMKWKELFETLEEATDICEDVANIVEGIVLEHA